MMTDIVMMECHKLVAECKVYGVLLVVGLRWVAPRFKLGR